MLGKLAVKNVKRNSKDYFIYLITIIISFSLMFALNLISTSEAVIQLSKGLIYFQYIMYGINVIVLGVICFLINYTTRFIFEKRSKEFGMYALLGIKKGKINKLFLLESLLLGFAALLVSMPIGFAVSQFLSIFIVNILELPQAIFIGLNLKSFVLLFIYFALIYLLVLWRAGRRMKKASINDLLTLEKQNEMKIIKLKKHRSFMFLTSVALGIFALVLWDMKLQLEALQDPGIMNIIFICFVLLIISIYGVMISAGDFILSVVLKNKRIKYSKDNLFIARTFSAKAKTMGFVFGTLSMLITLAVLFLNISGLNKGAYDYEIELNSPYDVSVADKRENMDDYLKVVKEDYTVKDEFIYDIYEDTNAAYLKIFPVYDYKSDEKKYDPVIRLSDYNKLLELRGKDKISLKKNEYSIVAYVKYKNDESFIKINKITLSNGIELERKELMTKEFFPRLSNTDYTIIVPDEAVTGLETNESRLIVNTVEETNPALKEKIRIKLKNHLTYINDDAEEATYYNVMVKGELIEEKNTMTMIISTICIYMAFIFIASVGTIIAIQSLSDSDKYKYRYKVLSNLGVRDESIFKTIRKQLLILFGIPIIYPIILNFCLITSINNVYKIILDSNTIYLSYFIGALAQFLIIYAVYYIATYFSFKRNIKEA